MAENDFTTGGTASKQLAATTSEVIDDDALTSVQASLDRMMNNGDDQKKTLIFNQVIQLMTKYLPDSPPKARTNTGKYPPAYVRNLCDASDKLSEAAYLAEFIQSISLNVPRDGTITLQPGQLAGFYHAMSNTIDRIREAGVLIDTAMAQRDVMPA